MIKSLKEKYNEDKKIKLYDIISIPRAINYGQKDKLLNRIILPETEDKMVEKFNNSEKRRYLTKTSFVGKDINLTEFPSVISHDVIGEIREIRKDYIIIKVLNAAYFNYICEKEDINKICAGMRYITKIYHYTDNDGEKIAVVDDEEAKLICFDIVIRSPHGNV